MPDKSLNVTHLMNHMTNQISALNDPYLVLMIFKKKTNWFGVGGTWLIYLLLIPLMLLLIIPFVFCLFHKIIISCITKYMTEPSTEMMTRLEAIDEMYSLIYDQ